jgi:repressor LexA
MSDSQTQQNRASLSERQKKILLFIEEFFNENGYPPTIREIGEAVDIGSTSVVNYNLNKLVKAGFIERSPDVSRGLRLIHTLHQPEELKVAVSERNENIYQVPLVGHIVASAPVEFFDYHKDEDPVEVPAYLLKNRSDLDNIFALRVKGESMIDALVGDGDLVVLQRQDTASNGDMVAVWLRDSGETTLKYFYNEGTKVRLQPANSNMSPIFVDARQVQVQGRVLAVLRQVP